MAGEYAKGAWLVGNMCPRLNMADEYAKGAWSVAWLPPWLVTWLLLHGGKEHGR